MFLCVCILLLTVLSSQLTTRIYAQTEPTFPLTINGIECSTKQECKAICDDPVNKASCKRFSQNLSTKQDKFLDLEFKQRALEQLGCSSAESCRAVCNLPSNYQICHDFSQQEQLGGGYDPRILALENKEEGTERLSDEQKEKIQSDVQLIHGLEEQLGIEGDLKSFCDQEENQRLCTKIARRMGIKGGLRLQGPGNCESEETCRVYCDDPSNFSECKQYEIEGIGGCASEMACYAQAQSNYELFEHDDPSNDNEYEPGLSIEERQIVQQELGQVCEASLEFYEGKPASEFTKEVVGSGTCEAVPVLSDVSSSDPCITYLNSDEVFDRITFKQYCELSAVPPEIKPPELSDPNDPQQIASVTSWCDQLSTNGSSSAVVIPDLCKNFVSAYQQARGVCESTDKEDQTTTEDEITESRYCLTAPKNVKQYAQACKVNKEKCEEGGYDWYCQQSANNCTPLYQGVPLQDAIKSFANARVHDEGDAVTVTLNDNTQEFAQHFVETNPELNSKIQVRKMPAHVFLPSSFSNVGSTTPTSESSTSVPSVVFTQPWHSLEARGNQPLPPNVSIKPRESTNQAQEQREPSTRWTKIKRQEDGIKQQRYIEQRQKQLDQRKTPIEKQERQIQPDGSINRPTLTKSQIEEQHRLQEEYRREVEERNIEQEESEPTNPSPQQINTNTQIEIKPTEPPRIEPTQPQTNTSTETSSNTNTNTNTTTNTTNTGSTDTSTTTSTEQFPRVQGVNTQSNVFSMIKRFLGL